MRNILKLAVLAATWTATTAATKPPNFVFILTDDQDWHMNSLDYMPLLHKHIIQEVLHPDLEVAQGPF